MPDPVDAEEVDAEEVDADPWVGRWRRDIAAATAPAHDQSALNQSALNQSAFARAVAAAGIDLLTRWREPHRRYHDLDHLAAVLDAVDLLAAEDSGPDPTDNLVVVAARLAAWFHDAVYAGRPGHDEADSADLAAGVLTTLAVPPALVAEVERLVRLTADHDCAADDRAGALLSDADLAVLAAPRPGYLRYVAAVRAEYAHVPDPDFRAGRAVVLRHLLAADPLYRTEAGRRRWQRAARANLSDELADLT
jgi:predicted metal-dependent HD superfamily phosphohydrolase